MPERHEVTVYDHDDDLVETVASFVADGLDAGEHVVVVATPAHRAALARALARLGAQVGDAVARGAYVPLDAAETLATFFVGGELDEALFERTIGGVIDAAGSGGHAVRAFGEMVALLWDDGNAAASIELEGMWNRLALRREFSLLCGYPTRALEGHPDLVHVDGVCRVHSRLIAPSSYTSGSAPADAPLGDVEPLTDAASRVFVTAPAAVPAARRWVKTTLAAWQQEGVLADAELVASELATNVVRHAGSAFRVLLDRTPQGVRLSFEDLTPQRPTLRSPSLDSLGGRGVAMVALVAADYGHRTTPDGKVVWAEFATSAA